MAAPLTDVGTPGSRSYTERRAWLHEYFDRTAAAAWATLTSDSQVSWVRRTVREGRERMRHTLSGLDAVKQRGPALRGTHRPGRERAPGHSHGHRNVLRVAQRDLRDGFVG